MAISFTPTPRSATTAPARRQTAETQPIINWIFTRDGRTLTCAVDSRPNRPGYDVCIVPHWDVSKSFVEILQSPVEALRRHAEVAQELREAGWVLAAYLAARDSRAAN